ncbi:DUF4345 domain-containing protein [Mycobacterium hackensackense]|uniref:DUF4345 domain-containing protein n=1 Tax=Mycobacterium hackensackense TaxID=228909 RepID=UPI002265D669|nr:DUF4345 domain-containing protein [Mycobacterium hackensackense]MCV7256681.1 DUF4345 domain-containing protein [Mycobacterium hackensackense]
MERAVSQPGNGRSRRGLQWTLAAVAVIPMASAVGEIVRGAQGVPGGSPNVPPTVDSSLRYANVFKFAMALMMWPQLGRVERSRTVTFSLATTFIGGLARMRSWQQRGRPHPVAVGAMALETIGAASLLAWQRSLPSHCAGEVIPDYRVSEVHC